MTIKPLVLLMVTIAAFQLAPRTMGQDVDGTDLGRELREREEKINRLTTEEQLKLRAAQQQAVEDPAVKAAMEKRDKALDEFRATLRASMIKADPAVEPILSKVAIPPRQ